MLPLACGRILLVDDDVFILNTVGSRLRSLGHEVTCLHSGEDALSCYDQLSPECVVVDLWMPGTGGLRVLESLLSRDPHASVILISGDVNVETTVRALRAGAEDVLTKPVDLDLLAVSIDRGLRRSRLARTHRTVAQQAQDPYGLLDESPMMMRIVGIIEQVAGHDFPLLIHGEPGTGKHAVAELIHQLSPRAGAPFQRIDCARSFAPTPTARPSDNAAHWSLETIASLIDNPSHGTLFFDEIGELTLDEQSLLLRLLPSRLTVGATGPRIIAATQRDLLADIQTGRFSPDLYQRICLRTIALPALRSRGEVAIRALAIRTLQRLRQSTGYGPGRFQDDALRLLAQADWPGNVRQLRLAIESAYLLAMDEDVVAVSHVTRILEMQDIAPPAPTLPEEDLLLTSIERRHIAHVLAMTAGQRSEAARLLGITRTTLYKKIRDFGLEDIGKAST